MDAAESQMGWVPVPGSTDDTREVLLSLSDCPTDAAAVQLAIQRAAEAVESDLCVYADGDLLETASSEATLAVPVHGRLRGHLVLARSDRDFDAADRDALDSIARALSLFEPGVGADLLDRLTLQDELVAGLARDEIQAYFLPKAELRTAKVSGVEALARWFHPVRGILSPADFLDLADAGGLLPAITERIIDLATRAAGDWWRSGLRLEISVNLPASALAGPSPRLIEAIPAALDRSGIPATSLRFDVTEDAVMNAADPATALGALTDLGAHISIDDFGTAHTSLDRLKHLAADELKIDRSFIRALPRGGEPAVVRSTIHLARKMGLRVLAEGVDSAETWRQLRGMGCDAAQGFLIGAPMSPREFLAWIASWDARGRELNTVSKRSPARSAISEVQGPERISGAAPSDRDLVAKP